MVEGNYYKFSQNAALQKSLLDTGKQVLAEASPVDALWGIELAADDVRAQQLEQWPESNLLGFARMQGRDRLRHLQ